MTKTAFRITVFIVCFGFAVTFAFLFSPVITSPAYPTDAELEEQFFGNQRDFERLVEMFQEDSHLSSVMIDKSERLVSVEDGAVPTERLAQYQDLVNRLGVKRVSRYPGHAEIKLLIWSSKNLWIGGKYKYYVFNRAGTDLKVDSLDDIYHSGADAGHYKSITKDWDLYLDVW